MSELKNPATQAERRAILKNDRDATTFHRLAQIDLQLEGGRFANVTGAAQTVDYPRLPNGPWSDGPRVPDEPPLGYRVDDLEPTGEAREVAASLAVAEAPLSELVPSSDAGVETATATPKRKWKRRI